MQWTEYGVLFVIELFCHKYTLVTSKGNGFWEVCTIDVVDGTPWTIHPMGTCLQNVMLEIVFVDK